MPPVKTVASSSDVDNDATAELPVLDVAAYEATLGESLGNTDTWAVPAGAAGVVPSAGNGVPTVESIPTLRPAEDIADLSGTHEMPASLPPNKVVKATALMPAPSAPPVVLPPSPPLIEQLRRALASAESRIEEVGERARIADAERAVAVARIEAENGQLREQLGMQLESLHTTSGRLGLQRADLPALEDELFRRADRIAALQAELAARDQMLAGLGERLEAGAQRAERLDTDAVNLRAAVARRDAQIAILEADLVARQARENALRERQRELLASIDPRVPELRAEIALLAAQIAALRAELAEARSRGEEKDADLQVAEESIRHLEIEVRDKGGKLEEANITVEEWRAVIAESQRSILQRDSRIRQLESDLEKRATAQADSSAQTGEEIALEGPARVLIRTDGNTDFVHVLGRRTRIGRGADNELVLDTKHISRYHAVLLAGPVHTTIEDLNSTNGVFVNAKRVARQALKDGDRVTIGRTHFRYTVRS